MEALGREHGDSRQGERGKSKGKKPSRATLTKAEAVVEALEKSQADELEALEKERRDLERRHERAMKAAKRREREAQEDYEAAIAAWEKE